MQMLLSTLLPTEWFCPSPPLSKARASEDEAQGCAAVASRALALTVALRGPDPDRDPDLCPEPALGAGGHISAVRAIRASGSGEGLAGRSQDRDLGF